MRPHPASTVLLVRDSDLGPEVLMLERRADSGFVPGAFVFPGGGLDPTDHDARGSCDDPDDVEASRQMGAASGGLAHRVAAVREAFEEAGVLLAHDCSGRFVDDTRVATLQHERIRLEEGHVALVDLVREHDLTLATGSLRSFGHWITPEGPPRRYDTRFFIAPAPPGQRAEPCGREAVAACWVTPADALDRFAAGSFPLILPTERCLRALVPFASSAALFDAVDRAVDARPHPLSVADRGGWRLALSDAERADAAQRQTAGSAA